MKPVVEIENWSICSNPKYPEDIACLAGQVYGHPRHDNGRRIVTTPILVIDGNRAETVNTIYMLGDPSEDYVKWCKNKGCHVPTQEEPILVR